MHIMTISSWVAALFWVRWCHPNVAAVVAADPSATDQPADPAEQIFRKTVSEYNTRAQGGDAYAWNVWSDLADELLAIFGDVNNDDDSSKSITKRLQVVGAIEESILLIERMVHQMGDPTDAVRDKNLAHLYYAYGKTLFTLTADECLALAQDPHTFLMGAEQVKTPSTHVCRENAENHLRNAVTLDATHDIADSLLGEILDQQADQDGIHRRKPKEFVAELFDSFADHFDEKLVKGLAYKVPLLVGQAAQAQRDQYTAILDAGCGTGLAGRYLRPLVPDGPLVGVDASEKMLAIARECTIQKGCGIDEKTGANNAKQDDSPLYDGLLAMDLEEMTIETTLLEAWSTRKQQNSESLPRFFDLVVAADVLVYFGRLDAVLFSFASVSIPGAVLIFSCERTTRDEAPLGWRLLSSGRFAHTKEHAVEAAGKAGYTLIEYAEIVPRMEKGEPVQGHLFTFVLQSQVNDEL